MVRVRDCLCREAATGLVAGPSVTSLRRRPGCRRSGVVDGVMHGGAQKGGGQADVEQAGGQRKEPDHGQGPPVPAQRNADGDHCDSGDAPDDAAGGALHEADERHACTSCSPGHEPHVYPDGYLFMANGATRRSLPALRAVQGRTDRPTWARSADAA